MLENQKPESKNNTLIIGVILLALISLGALLTFNLREPSSINDLERIAGQSRGHNDAATYDESTGLPPMGGIHHTSWQNCGVYREPIEAKNVVHSMEHGAVWIAYQPELSTSDVTKLEAIVQGQSHLIVSPHPGLKSPVVLTAWGLQLEVGKVSDKRIQQFIDRYQQGSQTPERGAACTNGIGSPLDR